MAAIAAAVAVSATVAATAASAVSAAKKAKAAKKGITQTSVPEMTPMGEAIQGTMVRLLMNRLNKPPQSFQDYMKAGPQAPLDMNTLSYSERNTYGLPPNDYGIRVQPSNVSPRLITALQKLGLAPSGGAEIRQGETPTAAPLALPVAGPRK